MTSGHVFVLSANLVHLNVDAWMLPTDAACSVRSYWAAEDETVRDRVRAAAPASFGLINGPLAFAVPRTADEAEASTAVATAVPSDNLWTPDVVRERVRDFARIALDTVPARSDRPPLLGIPFLGSKGGSAADLATQVGALLDAAQEAAAAHDVDIAVVFYRNPAAYTLAQAYRRADVSGWWPEIDAPECRRAADLGEHARRGRLVPFLGAGVSVSAGGPSWSRLLDDLTEALYLDEESATSLRGVNNLDRASLIESLYGDQKVEPGFRARVATAVDRSRYGLAPALLATIPSEGAITLNYDTLFERACEDAGSPRFVIPDDERHHDRWLLKLHGNAKKPESIVLTRDDYLGFDASRDALSALVKAHLITHHLLFVGFGLGDDHFYEIVHDVRRAIPEAAERSDMGTALMLTPDPLQERAWRGRLAVLPMAEAGTDPGAAGRQLEIFLDAMMAHATQEHRYLLAEGFGDGLSPADAALRADLLALVERHDVDEPSGVWPAVRTGLEGFGLFARRTLYSGRP